MQLQDIMSRHVATIDSNETIAYAARSMRDLDVGSLVVTDNGEVAGIITDRDIVIRCLSQCEDPVHCVVTDHMTSPVTTGDPTMDIVDAARMMREMQIKRLPVVTDGRLGGMISFSDLTHATDGMIHELHDVLAGSEHDR